MASPSVAANAYASLSRLTDIAALTKGPGAASSSGPDFGALLKGAVQSLAETSHKSDMQAQAVANGKSNIIDVVTAVSESETAIGALVSVRDRVIQSYEDILKMPI